MSNKHLRVAKTANYEIYQICTVVPLIKDPLFLLHRKSSLLLGVVFVEGEISGISVLCVRLLVLSSQKAIFSEGWSFKGAGPHNYNYYQYKIILF
jgi:hypothetical protein